MLVENALKHNIVSSTRPLTFEIYATDGHIITRNNIQLKKRPEYSTKIGLQNILKQHMILGVDEGNIDNMLSAVNVSNSTVNNQSPSQNSSLLSNYLSFDSEQMPDLSSLSLKKIKNNCYPGPHSQSLLIVSLLNSNFDHFCNIGPIPNPTAIIFLINEVPLGL